MIVDRYTPTNNIAGVKTKMLKTEYIHVHPHIKGYDARMYNYEIMYNELVKSINPFDILSGKVVINNYSIHWFKEAGYNMTKDGWPISENLFRDDARRKPCRVYKNGELCYGGLGFLDTVYDYPNDIFSKVIYEDIKRYNLIPE